MKGQIRVFMAVLGTLTLLVATVFTAFAGGLEWRQVEPTLSEQPIAADQSPSEVENVLNAAEKCPDMAAMQVSEPALWFATDEDQLAYPDVVVDSYPTGSNAIAAGFEYQCVPKHSKVTILFKYGGYDQEPWVTANTTMSPTNRPYVFHWMVYSTDKSPFVDSDYEVEFYWNKELLTKGQIMMGTGEDDNGGGEQVTVQGKIVDGKSKKPIKGAAFFVLNPGVTSDDWAKADFPDDDIYTAAQTDAKGKFVCERKVERNVTYSVMVGAKGYKPVAVDDFLVGEEDEDPVDLTIKLYK
jgi:hypothetical protein